MKQLWFLLMSIFTFSILIAQKLEKRTDVAVKNINIQPTKSVRSIENVEPVVLMRHEGCKTKTIKVKFMVEDEALEEVVKPVVEDKCEEISAEENTAPDLEDADDSFTNQNDPKVQAATNWFKYKKGLK
jgi:hypothetical protein